MQAIRMTGKGDVFKKDNDENDEESYPAIFAKIYDLRMEQLQAKKERKKFKPQDDKEFSLD